MLLRVLQHPPLGHPKSPQIQAFHPPLCAGEELSHSSTLEQLICFRSSMLLLLLLLYHHLGLQPPRRQGLKIDSHARATELFITGINN